MITLAICPSERLNIAFQMKSHTRTHYCTIAFFLLLFFSPTAYAQTLDVMVVDAACSANGSISVTVIGGSGDYTYQLSGPCLAAPLIQSSASFNNLEPCEYEIMVTDGVTGQVLEEVHTVGGDYTAPQLSLFCGSCEVVANVAGGAGPFTFAVSTDGIGGPFTPNTPPDNPVFDNATAGEFYWIQVLDVCGNIAVEECQSGTDAIVSFSTDVSNSEIEVQNIMGGTPPYTITLESSNGVVSNSTGVFPKADWGCNMIVSVTDGCTEMAKTVTIRPTFEIACTNLADGTATMINVFGIEPMSEYICEVGDSVYYSTDGVFSGLPINADLYKFRIVDACGVGSASKGFGYKSMSLSQEPVPCDDASLTIIPSTNNCSGPLVNYPIAYTCLSCPGEPTLSINNNQEQVVFEDQPFGGWSILVEDNCGDQFECHDKLELDLLSLCDSLKVSLVNRFECDNGSSTARPILAEGASFSLFDASGNQLSSNLSGTFSNITPGFYSVEANVPGCGFFQDTITVIPPGPISPSIIIYPLNRMTSGFCQSAYTIQVELDQGPFLLTGGPEGVSILLDNSALTSDCSKYATADIPAGNYQLTSLRLCGKMDINLPEIEIELQAEGEGVCPGSGSITVSGAQSRSYWENWSATNNINVPWDAFYWNSGFSDHYSVDVVEYGQFQQDGSPYTFNNIAPGNHTVYLYTFRSTCPIDTVEVFVPESDAVAVETTGNVLCDGAIDANVQFDFVSGRPPFTIELLDCNDLTQVLGSETFNDPVFNWTGLTEGDYCFRILDSCFVSLDHSVSVRPYQEEIELVFNCDNSITLKVDSLDIDYTWMDGNGGIVGNGHSITFPNPNSLSNYSVLIDLGYCSFIREIEIPMTQIIPQAIIEGEPILCEGSTNNLALTTDAPDFEWSTGATELSIDASTSGVYSVTVTNDLGCSAMASIELMEVPLLEPPIMGATSFCENDSTTVWIEGDFQQVEWSNGSQGNSVAVYSSIDLEVAVTDEFGCEWTNNIAVTENPLPNPIIEGDEVICENDSALLSLQVGYEQYQWSNGNMTSNISVPSGEYSVLVTDLNGCQNDTAIIIIEIPSYSLELGNDTIVNPGDQIQLDPLTDMAAIHSFLWTPTLYILQEELSPMIEPLESTVYQLELWDEYGCYVSDQVFIDVDKDVPIYAPTIFSPNDDGINDYFTIFASPNIVSNIRQLSLFDRWGNAVFDAKDFMPNSEIDGWDGRWKGEKMNPGVFIWKVEVEFIDGRIKTFYGDVTLVK